MEDLVKKIRENISQTAVVGKASGELISVDTYDASFYRANFANDQAKPSDSPFLLDAIEGHLRDETLTIDHVFLRINRDWIIRYLERCFTKVPIVTIDLHEGRSPSSFWVLASYGDRLSNLSCLGFLLRLSRFGDQLVLGTHEAFSFKQDEHLSISELRKKLYDGFTNEPYQPLKATQNELRIPLRALVANVIAEKINVKRSSSVLESFVDTIQVSLYREQELSHKLIGVVLDKHDPLPKLFSREGIESGHVDLDIDQLKQYAEQHVLVGSYLCSKFRLEKIHEKFAFVDSVDTCVRHLESLLPTFDKIQVLNAYFTYTYALAWSGVDVSKAMLAVRRLFDLGYADVDATNLLISVSRSSGDPRQREQLLTHALASVSNTSLKALIKMELAFQICKSKPDSSYKLTIEALSDVSDQPNVIAAAVENLMALSCWGEALDLLLRSIEGLILEPSLKVRFYVKAAEIQIGPMRQPAEAEVLLRLARTLEPHNLDVLTLLSKIQRDAGDKEKLAETLDEKLQILRQIGTEEAELRRITTELSDLYTYDLKDLDGAFTMYLSNPELVDIDPEALLQALSMSSARLDWRDLYESLSKTLPMLQTSEQRAKLHVCLGLVARDKMKNRKTSVQHFMSAVTLGWIDPSSLNFLKAFLANKRRYKELAEILITRANKSKGLHRQELMREVLAIPLTIDADTADQFALELLVDAEEEKAFVQRIDYYIKSSNFTKLSDLTNNLITAAVEPQSFHRIIEVLTESVASSKHPDSHALLFKLYKIRLESTDDAVSVAREAMTRLFDNVDDHLLRDCAIILVKSGERPHGNEERIHAILKDDPEASGAYFEILAAAAHDSSHKISYLKQAIVAYEELDNASALIQAILLKLCRLQKMELEDLAKLRDLIRYSQAWEAFADALESQLTFIGTGEWASVVCEELALLYKTHLPDSQKVIFWYEQAMASAEHPASLRYDLCQYLNDEDLKEEERSVLKNLISDKDAIYDRIRYASSLERLINVYRERDFVQSAVGALIHEFSKANYQDIVGFLAQTMISQNIVDTSLLKKSMVGAMLNQDLAAAKPMFIRLLAENKSGKDLVKCLEELKQVVVNSALEMAFDDWMAYVVSDEDALLKLPHELMLEFKAICIASLHRLDEHSAVALAAFRTLSTSIIEKDERLWVPSYLLLKDFGDVAEQREHLKVLIPLFEENPRSLRSTPFTIESLKNELVQLNEAPQPLVVRQPVKQSDTAETSFKSGEEVTKSRISDDSLPNGSLVKEWRGLVAVGQVHQHHAVQLMTTRFPSELEKHIALQTFVLLSGDVDLLSNWPWKVWRYPEQFGYVRDGRSRYPQNFSSKFLSSRLHRLLMSLTKEFMIYYRSKFKSASLREDMKLTVEQWKKMLRRVESNDHIIRSTNLIHIVKKLQMQKVNLYDLRGMNSRLFFAVESRSLYFDVEYYKTQPQSHLFHRLYGVLWSTKLGYLPFFQLDAETDLFPFIMKLKELAEGEALAKAKNILKSALDSREGVLVDVMNDERKALLTQLGAFTANDIRQIVIEMNRHVHRLLLAETLDLWGIAEAITGKDLLVEVYDPRALLAESEDLKKLVDFALLLRF